MAFTASPVKTVTEKCTGFTAREAWHVWRSLFSSSPQHGHLLPELPLARAFRGRGDDVAAITSAPFGPPVATEGITLFPVGPEISELLM